MEYSQLKWFIFWIQIFKPQSSTVVKRRCENNTRKLKNVRQIRWGCVAPFVMLHSKYYKQFFGIFSVWCVSNQKWQLWVSLPRLLWPLSGCHMESPVQCLGGGFAQQLLVFSEASHLEVSTRWRQRLTCLPPEGRLFEMQNEPHIPALGKQITLCKKTKQNFIKWNGGNFAKDISKDISKNHWGKNIQTNLMIFFL